MRRGEQSLVVVEVKRDGSALTSSDRDQAISYAVLCIPIAPLAIVTNGSDFQVYNAFTRALLLDPESTALHAANHPAIPNDLASIIDEASTLFLSLSTENLLTFCRGQVELALAPLRGSRADQSKKYIPELTEPRLAANEALDRFSKSSAAAFAVLAPPGSGKTCLMCAYAEHLLEESRPVIFYRGASLAARLFDRIAEDFNWQYGAEDTPRNLLRRLAQLTRGARLTIIIDAVDEWPSIHRAADLVDSCQRLQPLGIKVVFSCKSTTWHDLSTVRGVSTGLAELCLTQSVGELPPMDADEFHRAVEKYSTFYRVGGAFELTALAIARQNPFFLRVLFSVASARRQAYLTLSSIDFFREYLEQAISRLMARDQARLALGTLARLLFDGDQETAPTELLLQQLGGVAAYHVVRELLDFQILQEVGSPDLRRIGFYFSLLRDYLVVTQVTQWVVRPVTEVTDEIRAMNASPVGSDAAAFAYRYGGRSLQRALDESARQRAEALLRLYREVLDQDFASFREQFPPYTRSEIGLIGELDLRDRDVGWFGFRQLPTGEDSVQFLPSTSKRDPWDTPQLLELYGGERLQARSDFNARAPGDLAINAILGEELRTIFNHGQLSEHRCPELAAELAYTMTSREAWKLGLRFEWPEWPDLSVADLGARLNRHLLLEYHERVREGELLRQRRIAVEKRPGGFESWSWTPSLEDRAWIDEQATAHRSLPYDKILQLLRSEHMSIPVFATQLHRALQSLKSSAVERISASPLHVAAEHLSRFPHLKRSQMPSLMATVLLEILRIARRIIQENFPTIAGEFFSIAHRPLFGVLVISFKAPPAVLDDHSTLYLCKPVAGQEEDRFFVYERGQIQTEIERNPSFRFVIKTPDGEFSRLEVEQSWVTQRGFRPYSLFSPGYHYLPADSPSGSSGPRFRPIFRAGVYDWIRPELPAAFARLAAKRGVPFDGSGWNLWTQTRN